MLKVIIGHSNDVDSDDAIAEVLAQCSEQLAYQPPQVKTPQAGILFSAIDFDHPLVLAKIQSAFPDIALIGGTTDGELSSVMGFQEDSMTLMLFCSDTVKIMAGLGRGLSKDAAAAAQQAVESLDPALLPQAKLCLTVPDGVESGTEPALRSLQKLLPSGLPIAGGRAGDQFQFERTYQFFQGEVLQNALPILVFCGDLHVSHGIASGWQPLSRKGTITKVNGPMVYEIDRRPATEFFQEYLGEGTQISGEYPLAVFAENSDRFYLRASNHWDLETGSILFMGEIPDQATVQITYTTCDNIIAATRESIAQALTQYPGNRPDAALLFSCAARRWLLGNRTPEEFDLGQQVLKAKVPLFGFYTYGEIGPLAAGGQPYYHQETLITVLLGES